MNDPVPTLNYLLHQHIPEYRTPGFQSDFTESTILYSVKLCRLAMFPRHLLNVQRKDIQLENSQSSSYFRSNCPSGMVFTLTSLVNIKDCPPGTANRNYLLS